MGKYLEPGQRFGLPHQFHRLTALRVTAGLLLWHWRYRRHHHFTSPDGMESTALHPTRPDFGGPIPSGWERDSRSWWRRWWQDEIRARR